MSSIISSEKYEKHALKMSSASCDWPFKGVIPVPYSFLLGFHVDYSVRELLTVMQAKMLGRFIRPCVMAGVGTDLKWGDGEKIAYKMTEC